MKSIEQVLLGDYIEQVRGISYKPTEITSKPQKDFVPVLRATNFDESGLKLTGLNYIHKARISKEQFIQPGDILIASSSGSKDIVGKSVQFATALNASFGAFCKLVRVKHDFDPGFVGHFFKTTYYKRAIRNSIQGANINNLRNEHINELKIPRLKSQDQIHITNILNKAESLIIERKESLRLLDEMLKGAFLMMFGDPFTNPRKLRIAALEDIVSKEKHSIVDGPFGSSLNNGDYFDTGIPIIRINNIRAEGFYDSEYKYITESKYRELIRSKVNFNDILIARVGNTIGKSCIFNKSYKALLSTTGVAKATIDPKIANVKFINAQMRLPQYIQYIWKQTEGGGQPYLNLKKIKAFKLILPELSQQVQFARIVEKTESLKNHYRSSLRELENLYGALSQKAFKGELQ